MEKENLKLKELYVQKGELITNMELMQNKLQQINQEIMKELQGTQKIKNANTN